MGNSRNMCKYYIVILKWGQFGWLFNLIRKFHRKFRKMLKIFKFHRKLLIKLKSQPLNFFLDFILNCSAAVIQYLPLLLWEILFSIGWGNIFSICEKRKKNPLRIVYLNCPFIPKTLPYLSELP